MQPPALQDELLTAGRLRVCVHDKPRHGDLSGHDDGVDLTAVRGGAVKDAVLGLELGSGFGAVGRVRDPLLGRLGELRGKLGGGGLGRGLGLGGDGGHDGHCEQDR